MVLLLLRTLINDPDQTGRPKILTVPRTSDRAREPARLNGLFIDARPGHSAAVHGI
jgi:hypothetical protein